VRLRTRIGKSKTCGPGLRSRSRASAPSSPPLPRRISEKRSAATARDSALGKSSLSGLAAELEGKRIARQGTPVVKDGKPIGEVTSGTFGPTVQKSIAMAYVDANESGEGNQLAVDLKGTINPAKVVKLPFYKRAK
jgi:glycine cleavage system aminomethyltransferase T